MSCLLLFHWLEGSQYVIYSMLRDWFLTLVYLFLQIRSLLLFSDTIWLNRLWTLETLMQKLHCFKKDYYNIICLTFFCAFIKINTSSEYGHSHPFPKQPEQLINYTRVNHLRKNMYICRNVVRIFVTTQCEIASVRSCVICIKSRRQ